MNLAPNRVRWDTGGEQKKELLSKGMNLQGILTL
jgi:hypothetical protein